LFSFGLVFQLSLAFVFQPPSLIYRVTGARRFPPLNHATGFENIFGDEKAVKFQCLPITAAELGRSLRDRANWCLVTVPNHLQQSPTLSDSSRDR
jgi:hypothetical protein